MQFVLSHRFQVSISVPEKDGKWLSKMLRTLTITYGILVVATEIQLYPDTDSQA